MKLSRNIYFYKDIKLDDKLENRIIIIFIHLVIILNCLKNDRINKKLSQEIYDNIFLNIEYNLRELGDGDVAVNKKIKILNKVFYDILLKLNSSDSNKFKVSKNLIKKHLLIKSDSNDKIVLQIGEYLESFYDFCFELKDKNMIKGEIDFKY